MVKTQTFEQRVAQLIGELYDLNPSNETLGIVIRQALRDDPAATADDIREIWQQTSDETSREKP